MKQYINCLLLTLCITIMSCKTQKPVAITDLHTLNTTVENIFNNSELTGLSCLAIKNNTVIYEKNMGYADIKNKIPYTKNTVQNIASVSKTIIAVAIMKAIDQGKLNLDDDINDHLPFKVLNPAHPNTPITVKHLATHSSSINDTEDYIKSYYFPDAQDLNAADLSKEYGEYVDVIKTNELIDESTFLKNVLTKSGKWYSDDVYSDARPGDETEYSNVAATLAGYVVENATGMSYEDYTMEYIFKPLGMTQTTWDFQASQNDNFAKRYFSKSQVVPNYYLITKADGGLYSSTYDFSLFMTEMVKGFHDRGTLLSSDSYKTMFSTQIVVDDDFSGGIFWELGKTPGFKHDGSDPGVTTMVSYNATRDRALIIFTNVDANKKTFPPLGDIWNTIGRYDW